MKIAAFLTADRAGAAALLAACRSRHPGAQVVAFANDDDRPALAAAHPGIEFRRDKPPGGRVRFLRSLRAEGFDLAVASWHGGERFQPMRIVALFAGCAALVTDERGRERRVAWWQPWTWGAHLMGRAVRADALQIARVAAWVYRSTLGAAIAVVLVPARSWLARLARRP